MVCYTHVFLGSNSESMETHMRCQFTLVLELPSPSHVNSDIIIGFTLIEAFIPSTNALIASVGLHLFGVNNPNVFIDSLLPKIVYLIVRSHWNMRILRSNLNVPLVHPAEANLSALMNRCSGQPQSPPKPPKKPLLFGGGPPDPSGINRYSSKPSKHVLGSRLFQIL